MGSGGLGEFLSYFLLIYMNAGIFVTLATLVVFYKMNRYILQSSPFISI